MEEKPFRYFPKFIKNATLGINNLKQEILENIKFRRDNIEIGRGDDKVIRQERRGTAWLSKNPNLTFEYSGKVMKPQKMPLCIEKIRIYIFENFNIDFDGILVNYYYDNSSSMGYHSDPVDNKWTNDFMVISIGITREFIFREKVDKENKIKYNFEDGDMIYMFKDCQDKYEHCLKKGKKGEEGNRISLVFKKSI